MEAKIKITEIKDIFGGTMKKELLLQFDSIDFHGEEISFPEEAKVELTIVNDEKSYIIIGKVDLLLYLPCTRCLSKFEMPFKFDFDFELSKEEVEEDEIYFKEELLNNLMLDLPMQFICNEDCEGLCPSCGNNLNREDCDCIMHKVDPRLADLGKLFKKD